MDIRLYVGNLSYSTTEEELKELFSQAGAVTSVALIKDRDTGRSKGFAFIEMGSQVEAEKAITMFNGVQFNTRTLTVSIARPREERGPGGGGRGGSGGGYGDRDRRPGGGQRDRRSTGGTRRY